MADPDVRTFFEREIDQYKVDLKPGTEAKIEFIQEHTEDGARMLDVGCGSGAFARHVVEETPVDQVVGTEIARSMLPDDPGPLDLMLVDAREHCFREESFDVVHVDTVLHHVVGSTRRESKTYVADVVNDLFSLLTEDGYLLITERVQQARLLPDEWLSTLIFHGLKHGSRALYPIHPNMRAENPPICFYSLDELETMVADGGGEIVDIEAVSMEPPPVQRVFQSDALRPTIFARRAN